MTRRNTRLLTSIAIASGLGLAGTAFADTAATTKSFDDLDKDGNGRLSQQEAAAEKKVDFAKADVNEDGWLTRAEYETAIS